MHIVSSSVLHEAVPSTNQQAPVLSNVLGFVYSLVSLSLGTVSFTHMWAFLMFLFLSSTFLTDSRSFPDFILLLILIYTLSFSSQEHFASTILPSLTQLFTLVFPADIIVLGTQRGSSYCHCKMIYNYSLTYITEALHAAFLLPPRKFALTLCQF